MNRNVKVALCTLALMLGGCSIMSATSAFAAQGIAQSQIAAPVNGIVTKAYVKSINDAGVSVQSVIDQYADQIVEISDHAFEFCTEELDLSKLVKLEGISSDAFFKSNLKAINLSNVKFIGEFAFAGCKMLKNVELGALSKIYDGTFIGCSGLEQIVLPDSLKVIGEAAFAGTGLKSIRLPESVKVIDNHAFGGCKNMLYAVIENPAIELGTDVFLKSHLPSGHRDFGPKTGVEYYWFILGAPDNYDPHKGFIEPHGLEYTDVVVFCDNNKVGIPLSEMEGFKLLTISGPNDQIVTVDLNGNQELVRGFVRDDDGKILPNSDGTLVLAPQGTTHITNIGRLSNNVKTVVIPDGVVRILGDLPIAYNSKIDYVIPNSLILDNAQYLYMHGIKTFYTNNQTLVDAVLENNEVDLKYGKGDNQVVAKPLGGEQYIMLTDDVELQALWGELAALRAQHADHLALDDAASMFNDDEILASSQNAYDKIVAKRELKNKITAAIEMLRNQQL